MYVMSGINSSLTNIVLLTDKIKIDTSEGLKQLLKTYINDSNTYAKANPSNSLIYQTKDKHGFVINLNSNYDLFKLSSPDTIYGKLTAQATTRYRYIEFGVSQKGESTGDSNNTEGWCVKINIDDIWNSGKLKYYKIVDDQIKSKLLNGVVVKSTDIIKGSVINPSSLSFAKLMKGQYIKKSIVKYYRYYPGSALTDYIDDIEDNFRESIEEFSISDNLNEPIKGSIRKKIKDTKKK